MLIWRTAEKVFFPKFSRQFFAYNDKKYLVSREEMSLNKVGLWIHFHSLVDLL